MQSWACTRDNCRYNLTQPYCGTIAALLPLHSDVLMGSRLHIDSKGPTISGFFAWHRSLNTLLRCYIVKLLQAQLRLYAVEFPRIFFDQSSPRLRQCCGVGALSFFVRAGAEFFISFVSCHKSDNNFGTLRHIVQLVYFFVQWIRIYETDRQRICTAKIVFLIVNCKL